MEDHSWLEEWKISVGEERAETISRESREVGRLLHKNMESLIMGQPFPESCGEPEYGKAVSLAKSVNYSIRGRLGEVLGVECQVHCHDLYAGTADLVAFWDDKLSIVDFKNSRRPKDIGDVGSYFKQTAAYSLAHDTMFESYKIEQLVVIVAQWDCVTRVFTAAGGEKDRYIGEWLKDLSAYYGETE